LVTTGRVAGGRVEVLSGLEAGERVVATGVERVREGQPVKEGR
jgi:membrane fusion protein (multidrug efflux system)